MAAAGGDGRRIREAQPAVNHDAFLSAACLGPVALGFAVLFMPRGKGSMSSAEAAAGADAGQVARRSRAGLAHVPGRRAVATALASGHDHS
ncbi:hypothetical protein [Embleya sp. NPDC020886]|uniref:hypothetical protein n=1 Tax=Embleya sp. NPDC020886 TaxID=3363980 RepID=UPI0037969F41